MCGITALISNNDNIIFDLYESLYHLQHRGQDGFGISYIKNHPSVIDKIWGTKERIICIIMWPLAALVFIIAFIKESFKRLLKK